jgi:hypothetical protein
VKVGHTMQNDNISQPLPVLSILLLANRRTMAVLVMFVRFRELVGWPSLSLARGSYMLLKT